MERIAIESSRVDLGISVGRFNGWDCSSFGGGGGGGGYIYVWGEEADSLSISFLLLDVPTFQPSFFQEIFMHVDRILAWEKERERETRRLISFFPFSFRCSPFRCYPMSPSLLKYLRNTYIYIGGFEPFGANRWIWERRGEEALTLFILHRGKRREEMWFQTFECEEDEEDELANLMLLYMGLNPTEFYNLFL